MIFFGCEQFIEHAISSRWNSRKDFDKQKTNLYGDMMDKMIHIFNSARVDSHGQIWRSFYDMVLS